MPLTRFASRGVPGVRGCLTPSGAAAGSQGAPLSRGVAPPGGLSLRPMPRPTTPASAAGQSCRSSPLTRESAGLKVSDRQCLDRSLRQLRDAEQLIAGASASLAELDLPGPATPQTDGLFSPPLRADLRVSDDPFEDLTTPRGSPLAATRLSPAMPASTYLPAPTFMQQGSAEGSSAPESPVRKMSSGDTTWSFMDTSAKLNQVIVDQAVVTSMLHRRVGGSQIDEAFAVLPLPTSKDVVWKRACCTGSGILLPMLHPDAKIRLCWIVVGFCFIIYEAYAIPVYLAFDIDPRGWLLAFISVINLYFILDIGFQFLCCYNDPATGRIVSDPSLVARSYIGSWFIPDIISAIPWEWISVGDNSATRLTRSVRIVRAVRMLRLTRLMRIMKLRAMMERIETHIESNHYITFIAGVSRIFAMLFAMCHWGACIWYAIGSGDMFYEEHAEGVPASWVRLHMMDYPFIGEDKWNHYVISLYFTLTTMTTVGYGDITPTNYTEVCFCMVLLACSSIVFAGLMGTLTDMIGALNNQRHELAQKKMMLSRYMRWRGVSRRLTLAIRQHLLFMWDQNKGYDQYEEAIKMQLPPVLKAELCNHIYGHILSSAPFFAWLKDYPIVIKFLAEKVQSIFLERGDVMFRMGQRNEQIYMLLTGQVIASRNQNLFEDHHEAKRPDGEPVSFALPRRKEADLSAVGTMMVQRAKSKVSTRRISANGLLPEQIGVLRTSTDRKTTRPSNGGEKGSGLDMFDSEVLNLATVELRRQDFKTNLAVKKVQRLWRQQLRRRAQRARETGIEAGKPTGIKISRMRSQMISAPAYFGESCLWQPVELWDVPPVYMYAVRCDSRSETIYIPRNAILHCFERFAPWLQERHLAFQQAVAVKMQTLVGERGCLEEGFGDDKESAPEENPTKEDTAYQASASQARRNSNGLRKKLTGGGVAPAGFDRFDPALDVAEADALKSATLEAQASVTPAAQKARSAS